MTLQMIQTAVIVTFTTAFAQHQHFFWHWFKTFNRKNGATIQKTTIIHCIKNWSTINQNSDVIPYDESCSLNIVPAV
jgi:hypothetical protein